MTAYRPDKSRKNGIRDSIAVTLIRVIFCLERFCRVTVTVTKIRHRLIQLHTLVMVWKILKSGWKYADRYENPGVLTVYFTRPEE